MKRSSGRWIGAGRFAAAVATVAFAGCSAATVPAMPAAVPPPSFDGYRVWVVSEAADQASLIEFDGSDATVLQDEPIGRMPVEMDGPHGVAVSPDARYAYISLGHGLPTGWLLKFDTETDDVVGRTPLGLFPATVALTPDGEYAFISNFNLHGDPVPSSISKVHVGTMMEVSRTETCVMPHGSRVSPDGTRHYSVCMMNELLVELDVETGAISRLFSVKRDMEGPVDVQTLDGDEAAPMSGTRGCSPTWAEPSVDGSTVFVACNRAGEILEIDLDAGEIVRRIATGESPYNLAVTPDGGYLLATLRRPTDAALEIYDLGSGERVARVPTSTTHAHGIAVSEDSRYAFVSVEGVGAEPGKVDVIDLETMERVASAEVGQQATGIAIVPSN